MNTKRTSINWEEVRYRLTESQLAMEKALVPDPQRMEAVFRRRAAQLAVRRATAVSQAASFPVLVFGLGKERYGLELADLSEIFLLGDCTPVPETPPALLGVVNRRGEIRAVLDLARMLELPGTEERPSGYVLMLRDADRQVGLKVDRVEQVRLLSSEELTFPDVGRVDLPIRYVKGLTSDTLILLSAEALLSHPVFSEASHQ